MRSLLLLASLTAGIARASAFWMAPGGKDSGPGTAARPWRTFARAVETIQPGDSLKVQTGVYAERLIPTRSGTAESPITFEAAPGATPVIDGASLPMKEQTGLIHIERLAWITIRGFTVRNAGPGETATGILATRSDHVVIRGNRTVHTVSSGIGAWWCHEVLIDGNEVEDACHGGSQECISAAGCEGFEVRFNHVHDCIRSEHGGEGIDAKHGERGTVHHNHVHHIGRLGIYVDAWDRHTHDIEVSANVVHDCRGDGYAVAAEDGGLLEHIRVHDNVAYRNLHNGLTVGSWGTPVPHHPLKDIEISHNTFVNNGTAGWGQGILLDNAEAEGIVIRENLLSGNHSGQLVMGKGPRNAVLDHNLIDGWRGGEGETKGSRPVEARPTFRNASAGDFRQLPDSPGAGFGVSEP